MYSIIEIKNVKNLICYLKFVSQEVGTENYGDETEGDEYTGNYTYT